jgi:hypothetical protein
MGSVMAVGVVASDALIVVRKNSIGDCVSKLGGLCQTRLLLLAPPIRGSVFDGDEAVSLQLQHGPSKCCSSMTISSASG